MNFLVTGGAGFIGSHVCEALLRRHHAVWALDDLNDFYDPAIKRENIAAVAAQGVGGNFQFIEADITDSAAIDRVFAGTHFDQVIHLAARAGVRPSLEQPAFYQRVNVEGTVNILESARRNRVPKLTIASSSSVYGVNSKVPFSEDDPIFQAISPYAASKLACEALGHVYHHLYGFDVVMLRFFTVYGPRQRPDLAIHKFARLIRDGKPIPMFGDGSTARDYTFIDDIVRGVLACAERKFGFEIINLGGSRTVTLITLLEILQEVLGKKAVIDQQPLQPGDVPITYADVKKAQRLLNYQATTSIETGINRFARWFEGQDQRTMATGS